MSENNFSNTVESLFKGMDSFMTTKTVVGEAVTIKDTIILPLVDVSFGVGAGAWGESGKKTSATGGMGGKMSPTAVLVIANGVTKMVPVEVNQTTVGKIIDLVPEMVSKFTSKKETADPEVDAAVNQILDED